MRGGHGGWGGRVRGGQWRVGREGEGGSGGWGGKVRGGQRRVGRVGERRAVEGGEGR